MRAVSSRLVAAAVWVAFAIAFAGDAHAAGWDVRTLKAGRDAQMPWVTGPDAAVADRIDTLIFLEVLEAPPPRGSPTAFTVPTRDGSIAPVTPSGFRVMRQDERVLSLVVSAEGCGAYCEDFDVPFVFDLSTGRRVTDRDLLTPQGLRELDRRGHAAFAARIATRLAALKTPQPRGGLPEDDVETLREIYVECRERQRASAADGRAPGSLRLVAGGAELVFGRCSNHAMRALDDLDRFTFRIDAAALAARLTPYGRRLLLGQGDAAGPTGAAGQVLAGTVDGAAVRVAFSQAESDESIRGTYYYERFRKPIELSVRIAGGTWTLTENDDASGTRAEWTLRRDGDAWTGTWVGGDGRRRPVRLAF